MTQQPLLSVRLLPRACPLCGGAGRSHLLAEANVDLAALGEFAFASRKLPEYMHWRLWQCVGCDLLYANPAPSPEDLAALYRDADFASRTEARYASRTYARYLPRIAACLPDRAGALDIGTGDGVFLRELLNAGFTDVIGVEPSAAPVAGAAPDLRPLIHQGLFKPGVFAAKSFALVTCFQTIEHLSDPLETCREAWRVLKPGGALFLIGHNRRSVSARVLGRKSPIFDIEHLQLFSPRSVRRLMELAGFRDVSVRPVINRYPLAYWSGLFPMPGTMKRLLRGFLEGSGLGRIPVPLPAGNLAAIGCK